MADIKINSIDWWKTQGGTKNDIYDIQREVLQDILGKPVGADIPYIFTDAFNQALVDSTGKSRGVPIIDKVNYANRNRLANFLLESEIGRFLVDGDSLIDGMAYSDDGDRTRLDTTGFAWDAASVLTVPFDLLAGDVVTSNGAVTENAGADTITVDGGSNASWIKVHDSTGLILKAFYVANGIGPIAYDKSANGFHAVLTLHTHLSGDIYISDMNLYGGAKGIHFLDTSSEHVEFGDVAVGTGSADKDFRVKFIFNKTGIFHTLISKYLNASTGWILRVSTTEKFDFFSSNDGTAVEGLEFAALGTLTKDTYYDITVEWRGNTTNNIRFVQRDVNGTILLTETIATAFTTIFNSVGTTLLAGARRDTGLTNFMNGILLDCSVFEGTTRIWQPSFNKELIGATQYSRGTINPTGVLTSGAAVIYLPLVEGTDLAVFGLPSTGLPNIPVAQRLKMTDGICKDCDGTNEAGRIIPSTPFSINGVWEIGLQTGAATGRFLYDTRNGSGQAGWELFQATATTIQCFYTNGAGSNRQQITFGVADTQTSASKIRIEIDLSAPEGISGIGTIGSKFKMKQQLDPTISFEDSPYLLVTASATDLTTDADQTITDIHIAQRFNGASRFDGTLWDVKLPNGQCFPIYENGGNSYSTDGLDIIVWLTPFSNWGTNDLVSFHAEKEGANSGFRVGVNTNQIRIDLAAISAGNNFDVEILNVDTKTADQGYLFQTLTGDAYRLYIHTDGNVYYEVEDSGLVDSGYTHIDKDSYKLLFNNGVIDLEVNGVNQATDTCTATTLTQGILMMYNSSAGTISLRGTSAGFNIYELSLLIASWRGEQTTVTREAIALTNYAGARLFFARGSNNRDQYGKKIDFASIPITGFDLDKEELTPELEPVVDTNILNTAYTDGLTSMVRQLLHPGSIDRLLLFFEDIALESGPLIAKLIAARNLINDPLVDLLVGIGNPFSDDLAEFAIVDSGADGSLAGNGGGVADLQTGVTNTGGNDGINKTSIVIISGHNILTVAKFMRTDNLTSGTARYEGDIATSNFFNAATAGLVSGIFKEGKNYDLSTGVSMDVYITPLGTFALPNGLKVRELRSYDLTINQAAA